MTSISSSRSSSLFSILLICLFFLSSLSFAQKTEADSNNNDNKEDNKQNYTYNPLEFVGEVEFHRTLVVKGKSYVRNVLVQNLVAQDVIAANLFVKDTRTRDITCTGTAQVNTLSSPTGTVVINGNLAIVNSKLPLPPLPLPNATDNAKVSATAFIAEDVVIGGVKQWKLVAHDMFDATKESAAGWSMLETSSCQGRDYFLGGHCNIANGQISKRFENLPPHNQVRITGRYHMIDNWQGETAFLKLDEHYAWVDHSYAPRLQQQQQQRGIDMCGSSQYRETRMSIPVDVTQAHTASFIEVAFGSNSLKENENPCDRSFGVDDVMVYVR